MKELLEIYDVSSLEELKELVENNDEKVTDLIEFLNYVKEREREEINETKKYL